MKHVVVSLGGMGEETSLRTWEVGVPMHQSVWGLVGTLAVDIALERFRIRDYIYFSTT